MEQRLWKAINGEDEEKFRQEDCIEACSIGVANSEILIPAFKRTIEQKRKVTQVLEFLKDFEISENDVIDLQIYIKKQRGLGDISAACCFQIFDYRGERFCYLFNLKSAVIGQGVGRRLFASIKTAVEYDIVNWEYNSLFPEKKAPPQIVHYLASVGSKMPADSFYIKQGFLLQDNNVEQWAHQDRLKLYHLESQPNFMSQQSEFMFKKKAATINNEILTNVQTNEEEKQEGWNQIQMLEQQNNQSIESVLAATQKKVMEDKSGLSGVSHITTGGTNKMKHCRQCKKMTVAKNWARHVKSFHNDESLGFDLCTGDNCLLCKETPVKILSNRNKTYTCLSCPNAKPVRKDTTQGKGGKCFKCGTQFFLTSSKSFKGELISGPPIKDRVSVLQLGKRPAPKTMQVLKFDTQDNEEDAMDDNYQHMSKTDMRARLDYTRKVDDYLENSDLLEKSPVSSLSRDTALMSMSMQTDTKPLSTAGSVVRRLQLIEKNSGTTFALVTAAQSVQSLCSSFLDEMVYRYMEQQQNLTMLREAVNVVQQRTIQLSADQSAGIFFASFVLGGDCLPGAIKSMLTLRTSDSFQNVFSLFMAAITTRYGDMLGKWVGRHWEFINSTHLKLISTMRQTLAESDVNLLTLLITVTVSSSEELQTLIQFIRNLDGVNVYEILLDAIEQNPRQAGITNQQFFELIFLLQDNQFQSTIYHMGDDLLQIKLCEWATTINITHQKLSILNAASAQQQILELSDQIGEIHPTLVDDLRRRDQMIAIMFDSIQNSPNERQFAVSQYALGLSYTEQRQMWVVPSGQGKSRIIATLAYLALKSGMYKKVVLVFSNEDLMKRDKEDFADMWSYFPGVDVSYQVGIPTSQYKDGDYTTLVYKGALVIVDEADSIMYDNPSMFHTFIQGNCCISFTATPDDNETMSIESNILKHMNFKRFDYIAVENCGAEVQINSVRAAEKVKYVIDQLQIGPILLFCDESFASLIQVAAGDQNFINVLPGVDQKVLRTLDKKVGQLYKVAVCVNEFGIRGIDYRSPNAKLTLVIAKSFMHQRDYMQGIKRVGRFKDSYSIVRFDDVPLIDSTSAKQYKAKLFQFFATLLGKAGTIQLKTAKINKVPVVAGEVTVPTLAKKMGSNGVYKSDQSRLQRLLAQPSKAIGQQTILKFISPLAAPDTVSQFKIFQYIQQKKE